MAVLDKTQTMSIEAGKQLLDQEARKYLGMSADEFLSAWDKGAYEGRADTPEVMRFVEIIPFAR